MPRLTTIVTRPAYSPPRHVSAGFKWYYTCEDIRSSLDQGPIAAGLRGCTFRHQETRGRNQATLKSLPTPISPSSDTRSKPRRQGPRLMAHPSESGGTSLAPTPTHPHQLSRETSKDELEMAESLRLLNQTHDQQKPRVESPSQEQQQQQQPPSIHGQENQRSEIYHSLEDAVPIANGPPTPSTSASMQIPNMNYEAPNAPITGQICR